MWYLTSVNDPRVLYITPPKSQLTIGRSPDPQICDFAIQDDASISRKHATLALDSTELFLTDLGSRYGTYINSSMVKLEINNKVKLSKNDTIKFGKMNSVWKVNEMNFVTCTSTLKGENLQNMKLNLSKIGGILKNEWEDSCEYLTMPAITLTIKVVLALVQGSHIVTTGFWIKCVEAIHGKEALPDPKKYTPDILESTLNKEVVSFLPNKYRASLFAGKKFVFFSKRQFDMYKNVLMKSSATPLMLSEAQFTKSKLCEDEMVVIQYNVTSTSQETEAQKNQIVDIVNYLKSKGKRVVADAEIGLAILYCSTVKYCNPGFNFSSEVVKQAPAQSSNKVLAPETQEQTGVKSVKDNVIINESLTSNDGHTPKRKLSDINDDEPSSNASKKVAKDAGNLLNESAKRKHIEDDDSTSNPSKKVAVDQDDDFFNFITPASKADAKDTVNQLNLAKPQKRKADFDADEDLFNFVQGENTEVAPKRTMFEEQNEARTGAVKTEQNVTAEDIALMRGAKLDELNKENLNFIQTNNIKKEVDEELDEKMNLLNIDSIVVTIKKELIVKKEPLEIEEQEYQVKNFKKFKKVWPLKMQVTIIPRSSMSTVTADGNLSAQLSHDSSVVTSIATNGDA